MSAQPAGEKTEKATPKRKREAREKGQVFKSVEVISAFSLIVLFGVLMIFGKSMAVNIKAMMRSFFTADVPEVMDSSAATQVLGSAALSFLKIVAPVLIAAFLCGLVFNLVQVGFNFSSKAVTPKLEKISMLSGFKRIFSKRTLIELLKSTIKIVLLGWVAYSEYRKRMNTFAPLMGENLEYAISVSMDILLSVAFKLGLAFAIFAPFDYMYQRWKHNKDLMMTKQELREEYKLTEGNPQTKSRIAQKQRQMSRMRMVQAVKDADVVITNPTHYAVALSYKEDKHKAPVVVAKGKDYLAQRIKEEAREHRVEIVENRPVAQSLYFFCEVGDEVPEDLYKAVAEILAVVYRLKKKAGR
jgi:flagellar biosynthetic protein FlhB